MKALVFQCDIFSQGVQKGLLSGVRPNWAQKWDALVSRMCPRIYEGLVTWLGPFSSQYPVHTTIQLLPQKYRERGVNALFDKDKGGKIYLNLDMCPKDAPAVESTLPYCVGNLLHEFMHANLADFIYAPPEGTPSKHWAGDSFYDEGYLDFMGEIISSDQEIWQDEEFGNFADRMFAGYVAMNNRRLQNALGISPGQEWSDPDFHIKRWAGQEYARKIGGNLFQRFVDLKKQKRYVYPVGCGPKRNYDVKTK